MKHIVTKSKNESRAVVVGGSIAGLLTARVLADFYDEVVLFERDRYPEGALPRRGVSQGHHVHLLLMRGMRILDNLFPGLLAEMAAAGAPVIDPGRELCVLSYWGWRVQFDSEMEMLTFTRPFLDRHILRRLRRHSNLNLVDGTAVNGLEASAKSGRVTGVKIAHRGAGGDIQVVEADLIVAANGRYGRMPDWLSKLGHERPAKTEVDPQLGYSSAIFRPPARLRRKWKWKGLLLLGDPPHMTRGGVILPVEGDRWLVTIFGNCGDYPPTDYEGFLEFAATLRSPLLYEGVRQAEPLSAIRGNRSTKNVLHHYHELPNWPQGLLVVGDALCAFNPVYGQGMSVAAIESLEIANCLRGGDSSALTGGCQQRLYDVVKMPWLMAIGEDLRWGANGAKVNLSTRIAHRYLDRVLSLVTTSQSVAQEFTEVSNMLKSPLSLIRPGIAVRVLLQIFGAVPPAQAGPLPGPEWMAGHQN